MASADLRDEEAIRKGIARAEFVKKGKLLLCSQYKRLFAFQRVGINADHTERPFVARRNRGLVSEAKTSSTQMENDPLVDHTYIL